MKNDFDIECRSTIYYQFQEWRYGTQCFTTPFGRHNQEYGYNQILHQTIYFFFFFFLGVNSYSQIVSAFRAQGDLTDDQLSLFPVLQNTLGVSRERHTAEIKRALYDEQLSEIASR